MEVKINMKIKIEQKISHITWRKQWPGKMALPHIFHELDKGYYLTLVGLSILVDKAG